MTGKRFLQKLNTPEIIGGLLQISVGGKMKFATPKPNQLYYKLYFVIGLLKYPDRLINLLKFKLSKFATNVNYYPIMMDIEPTQRCNYRCLMCSPFNKKRDDMQFEEFKNIIDQQIGLMEVKIQGVGEPLLNKDFFKMIHYAKKRMLWVRTTTNGSLLHFCDNYKKLVDSKVHDINISIDGATKEVYESIRIGGDFEQIAHNCKLINDYNNYCKKTVVRAWAVLQKRNLHQFFDFPKLFSKLGFKEITYSFAMHNYGKDDRNRESTSFTFNKEDFSKLFRICRELDIKISFFFLPHFDKNSFCQIPFKRIYVTTDSHILPCCYIANQEIVDFGKYLDFKKIWFEDYNHLRASLKSSHELPFFCQDCYRGE
jgi:pyrroloquinoline quinone biosynthesis protein E